MIMGGAVYAFVVGGICGIFSNMNPHVSDYHNAMDSLNSLMADFEIDRIFVQTAHFSAQRDFDSIAR